MTKAPNRERTSFSEEDGKILLAQAFAIIESALYRVQSLTVPCTIRTPETRNQEPRTKDQELATAPVVGIFVSLKRGHLLRACCGSLNEKTPNPLGELLQAAAEKAALADTRFPRITKEELASLEIEISLMHNLKVMPADPNLRINLLTIGKHGLIISHPKGRGLLLPQVAFENNWDSLTFLQQVCKKANLPTDTWLRPEAELKQFRATIFHKCPEKPDLGFSELPSPVRISALKYATDLIANGGNASLPENLSIPVSPTGWGLLIQTSGKSTEAAFSDTGTLGELIKKTVQNLHQPGKIEANKILDFLAFSHPIRLNAEDYPLRMVNLQKGTAITARKEPPRQIYMAGQASGPPQGERTAVVVKQGPQDPVEQALRQMGQQPSTWQNSGLELQAHLVTNLVESLELRVESQKLPQLSTINYQLSTGRGIRLPAVAGSFYPGSAVEIKAQLDRYFLSYNKEPKLKVRAVLLPHAGWKYCGDIIAETLGQIEIPEIVVLVSPKHTPLGSRWSISHAKSWRIPGAEIPLDEESVAYLAARIKGLEKEELAHQKEHGIEVLLPFFHYLNPKVKIVPIVLGSGTYDHFVEFGRSLQTFRERVTADGENCLFVISSDLNHFAEDKVNRILDKKALDILKTGDTKRLYETCTEHNISMCGLRPAVAVISSLGIDAQRHCPDIEIIRYETSARILNDPTRVVGYAGVLLS